MAAFGKTTLGLTYSLVLGEAVLSPAIPSVAARAGGIFFPLAKVRVCGCSKWLGRNGSSSSISISMCLPPSSPPMLPDSQPHQTIFAQHTCSNHRLCAWRVGLTPTRAQPRRWVPM